MSGDPVVQVNEVQTLVDRWQPRLGLNHWHIEIKAGDLDHNDAILEIQRHENAHRAVLHVASWLTTGDYDQADTAETIDATYIEKSVVHELAHLLFRDVVFPMRDDLEEFMGQIAHELFMRQINRHEEAAVDSLASALVNHWPKGKP